jgi:hypothetical protein
MLVTVGPTVATSAHTLRIGVSVTGTAVIRGIRLMGWRSAWRLRSLVGFVPKIRQ